MLTESFIASVGVPIKPPSTSVAKDAAIFAYELHPLVAQQVLYKKSATLTNCLAFNESHVFAAQAEKAVVNVYNRPKGTQEATVPFTERITCITLACDDSILVLGTAEGRLFLWELGTGRHVTTGSSHLQAVTSVTVDLTSNFLLSASADSTIHIWSLPNLLTFAHSGVATPTPLRTLTTHRAEVVGLCTGHSANFGNIVASISKDQTCLIWDLHTGTLLRTFLLSGLPSCITLDAADRAVYIGYEDGRVQQLDLYSSPSNPKHMDAVQNGQDAAKPIQVAGSSIWAGPNSLPDPILSIALTYDGSIVLTGHASGSILSWEVGRAAFRSHVLTAPLPGPVTNLQMVPIELPKTNIVTSALKPKFGAWDHSDGAVPGNYAITAELKPIELSGHNSTRHRFLQDVNSLSFSSELLDEGLAALAAMKNGSSVTNEELDVETDDFMALDTEDEVGPTRRLEQENSDLKAQIQALKNLQAASFKKIETISAERRVLLERQQRLAAEERMDDSEDST